MDPHSCEAEAAITEIRMFYGSVHLPEDRKKFLRTRREKVNDRKIFQENELVHAGCQETCEDFRGVA